MKVLKLQSRIEGVGTAGKGQEEDWDGNEQGDNCVKSAGVGLGVRSRGDGDPRAVAQADSNGEADSDGDTDGEADSDGDADSDGEADISSNTDGGTDAHTVAGGGGEIRRGEEADG